MKKTVIFLIILFAFTGMSYASYEDALKLYEEKNYRESLDMLGEELTVADDLTPGSQNYKLRFLAAHNHWKLGNIDSAVTHFKRCMDIEKENTSPYIDLALLYADNKRLRPAELTARKGLKIKEEAMLFAVIGKVSLLRKKYWQAKEYFEKANSINSELVISYNGLGVALLKLKKYSEANTAFTIALMLNPESSEIMNNLGLSYEKSGNNKEALNHFEKASSINPENALIKKNLRRVKNKIK